MEDEEEGNHHTLSPYSIFVFHSYLITRAFSLRGEDAPEARSQRFRSGRLACHHLNHAADALNEEARHCN